MLPIEESWEWSSRLADENARRVKQQLSDQAAVLVKEKEKEKEPGAQPGHRDAHGHTVKISEKALRLKAEEEARQKEADELNRLLDEKLVRCRLNTEPTIVRSAGPMASANAACRWDQCSAQPWFTEFAYRWTAHYSRYSLIALFGACLPRDLTPPRRTGVLARASSSKTRCSESRLPRWRPGCSRWPRLTVLSLARSLCDGGFFGRPCDCRLGLFL